MNSDPVAFVVAALAVILAVAKLGGEVATRSGQPAVLGELLAGVLLGAIGLFGVPEIERIRSDPAIDMLARIGVVLLLFEVGLESTVSQMLKVGSSSILAAILGVAASIMFGFALASWIWPDATWYGRAFLGASIASTSVGITARVLKDLGKSATREAHVILGAAVIDDVIGLVLLSMITALLVAAENGQEVSFAEVGIALVKAAGFLCLSLALGIKLSPKVLRAASRLKSQDVLLASGLVFCFALSYFADAIGLAPIIGAFAAGLVLEKAQYAHFEERGEHPLDKVIHPISSFLVPVFFVVMGMRTSLAALVDPHVLLFALALVAVAVLGKLLCAAGVTASGVDRRSVGIGMVPRGEVTLIFAAMGSKLSVEGRPLVDEGMYSALITTVVVTSVLTPPMLRWSLGRETGRS